MKEMSEGNSREVVVVDEVGFVFRQSTFALQYVSLVHFARY
jgi:hypothetical protein